MIVFSFSKRECEALAAQMSALELTDAAEKKLVDGIFWAAMECLGPEDRKLPQVGWLGGWLAGWLGGGAGWGAGLAGLRAGGWLGTSCEASWGWRLAPGLRGLVPGLGLAWAL